MSLYEPAVTPSGNPGKVGVVVATPAFPTPGTAVQQWMCEAVVVPVNPENETMTSIVFAVVLTITSAKPIAVAFRACLEIAHVD